MDQKKFNSLINTLTECINDYELDDSFDLYDVINHISINCDYSFKYFKAWQLVSHVKFIEQDLFQEVEDEVIEYLPNKENANLDDIIMNYAFHILKIAITKKYNEQ